MPIARPTVYAVQEARVNLAPATEFGNVRTILPEGDISYSFDLSLERLQRGLASFNTEDYLLAVGDPTAIGVACVIVSQRLGGCFRMLKWDKQERRYLPLEIRVPVNMPVR